MLVIACDLTEPERELSSVRHGGAPHSGAHTVHDARGPQGLRPTDPRVCFEYRHPPRELEAVVLNHSMATISVSMTNRDRADPAGYARARGHQTVSAHNVPQACKRLPRVHRPDHLRLPHAGAHRARVPRPAPAEGYETPLIMLTGYGSIEHAVAAIKAGAIDYITKPVRPEQLELAVNQALEVVGSPRERALRKEVMEYRNERQIMATAAIRRVLQTIATAAPTRATVLLEANPAPGRSSSRDRFTRRASGATAVHQAQLRGASRRA